ncbi:carbohydrate ABC transporter permease [Clostridia bacterium]|nr:carbohydrate ABC transporter permease [Clostridia bacterium]
MNRKKMWIFIIYVLIALIVIIAGFPFLWMVSTSVKPDNEILMGVPKFLPNHFYWRSYVDVMVSGKFLTYFGNSMKVAGITTAITMAISICAGLAFARFDFIGRRKFQIFVLFAQLFPLVLLITPYFRIMGALHILDSHLALYMAYTSFVLPFSIWMLTNYFKSIPDDMEQAAMIDGCTKIQAFVCVTLPLAAPGIVATTINAFTLAWNEFLFAQTFINSPALRTLPIGLRSFMGQYDTQWNLLMAGSVISAIPVIVLFMFLQKYLIAGLSNGGVKG